MSNKKFPKPRLITLFGFLLMIIGVVFFKINPIVTSITYPIGFMIICYRGIMACKEHENNIP